MSNQIHRYTSVKKGVTPLPSASFYADVGTSTTSNGADLNSWTTADGSKNWTSLNVPDENPTYRSSQGGLTPTIQFNSANNDRMFTTEVDDDWKSRGEGTLVFVLNHASSNAANMKLVTIRTNNNGNNQFFAMPRTGVGRFRLQARFNSGTSVALDFNSPASDVAHVVIVSRALDGTTAAYIDGVVEPIVINTFPAGSFIPNGNIMALGDNITNTNPGFLGQNWTGQLSAIELYDIPVTALQATDITTKLQTRFLI